MQLDTIKSGLKKNKYTPFLFNDIDPNNNSLLRYLPFVILFIVTLLMHRFAILISGDDTAYQQAFHDKRYFDFITNSYFKVNGRVSTETILYFMVQFDIYLWRFINPLVITLMAYFTSRLVLNKNDKDISCLKFNCLCCFGWGYINSFILSSSVFWFSGSFVYLWTVTAALYAILPYKDALTDNYKFSCIKSISTVLCVIYVCWGQQQVGLTLTAFAIIFSIYLYLKNKRIQLFLIVETLLTLIFTCFLLFAPGVKTRYYTEIKTWFPEFIKFTTLDKLEIGIQWFMKFVINEGSIILMVILMFLSIGYYRKYKSFKKRFVLIIPTIGSLLLIYSFICHILLIKVPFMGFLFEFNLAGKPISNLIPYLLWGCFLLQIPLLIVLVFGKSFRSALYILLLVATVCNAAIMFFSPTIYASGYRVFFPTYSILYIILILIIYDMQKIIKTRTVIAFSIFPCAHILMFAVVWKLVNFFICLSPRDVEYLIYEIKRMYFN